MRYRSSCVFSLGAWTPHLPTGLACPVVLTWWFQLNWLLSTGLSPCLAGLSRPFDYPASLHHGLLRVRSPLLAESFLFLRLLRCFSSPGSLHMAMCSPYVAQACPCAGFPIRIFPAVTVAHTSPRLFAVYHVLHRHTMPRHPPYALSSFLHLINAVCFTGDPKKLFAFFRVTFSFALCSFRNKLMS